MKINRRDFLKKTLVASASVAAPHFIPASALGRDGIVAPSERIVVGCIGVGDRGSYLLKSVLELPEHSVVGDAVTMPLGEAPTTIQLVPS